MINFADLNGGSFGKTTFTDMNKFSLSALYYAHVLSDLFLVFEKHKIKDVSPSYGFSISTDISKNEIDMAILNVERLLPIGISFYEVDGRRVFEMRGPLGGLVSSYVCYLIAK